MQKIECKWSWWSLDLPGSRTMSVSSDHGCFIALQCALQEPSPRSSGRALCDMSNLWFCGACGFVPWLTEFCHLHCSPAKEKTYLSHLTVVFCCSDLIPFKNGGMSHYSYATQEGKKLKYVRWKWAPQRWEELRKREVPLRWDIPKSWKIAYSGRKVALPHCLPTA